jgi:hypothetical protein
VAWLNPVSFSSRVSFAACHLCFEKGKTALRLYSLLHLTTPSPSTSFQILLQLAEFPLVVKRLQPWFLFIR